MPPGDVDEIELRPLRVVEETQLYSGKKGEASAGKIVTAQIAAGEDPLREFGKRYSVISKIGQGSMGSVFKVLDRELDAIFAIKILKPEAIEDEVTLRRFEQESEAMSGLTHPNVVAVYGHGQTEAGLPYLIMDFVDGETLAQRLQRDGFLPAQQALDFFIQLCDALENVHGMHIIHRDLKPSNILLEKKSNGLELAKIADFGISKLTSNRNEGATLTETGAIIGTPHYMSPEQCLGDPLDARSDIYSLGCVMYECFSGKPPFVGANGVQVVLKHLKEAPKSLETNQRIDVPKELAAVVMRCLNKEPSLRYGSVSQLRKDLELLRDGGHLHILEDQHSPSVTRRAASAAIDFAIVFCIALVVLQLLHAPISLSVFSSGWTSAAMVLVTLSMLILGAPLVLWLLLAEVTCHVGYNPEFWHGACLSVALLTDMLFFVLCEAAFGCTPGKLFCRLTVRDGLKRASVLHCMLRYLAKQLWFFGNAKNSARLYKSKLDSLPVNVKGSRFRRWLQGIGNSMAARLFVVKAGFAGKQLPYDVWCRGRVVFRNSQFVQVERLPPMSDIQHDLKEIQQAFRPFLIFICLVLLVVIPNVEGSLRAHHGSAAAGWLVGGIMSTVGAWPILIEFARLRKLKKRVLAQRKASIEKGRS